jgi:drug/metabolite transporter (DMT)-like permease
LTVLTGIIAIVTGWNAITLQVVLLVVLGYLFFDEIPNALTVIRCSIILLAGMYAIGLERRSAAAGKLATLDHTSL